MYAIYVNRLGCVVLMRWVYGGFDGSVNTVLVRCRKAVFGEVVGLEILKHAFCISTRDASRHPTMPEPYWRCETGSFCRRTCPFIPHHGYDRRWFWEIKKPLEKGLNET